MQVENLIDKIRKGCTIENLIVDQEICISGDKTKNKVQFEKCKISSLIMENVEFKNQVIFKNCIIENISFAMSYFRKGLIIEDCIFNSHVDFQCGIQNTNGIVSIERNTFNKFLNFFDCEFKSQLFFSKNTLLVGTNLLGNKGTPFEVQFNVLPLIEDNKGTLTKNGEN